MTVSSRCGSRCGTGRRRGSRDIRAPSRFKSCFSSLKIRWLSVQSIAWVSSGVMALAWMIADPTTPELACNSNIPTHGSRREIIWQVSCACQVFFGLFFAWKVSFSEGKSRWMRETNKLGAWEEGAKHRERKSFNIPFRPFPHESVPSRVVIIYPVNK
ncbi:hypothetical protein QR685DRAFT_210882 [Neurospora intermedia]|uniref:Uncharacterized protein n=1 Tax=Neurospora intermedia TaxID=5142 RepID=A0ABR3DIR7_NEUIN